jgi:hypothetical protein
VAIVEIERSAETLAALDGTLAGHGHGDEKAIVQALMISLTFIVLDKLSKAAAQVCFVERNGSAWTLLPDRAHPAFRVCVEIRAPG